MEGESKVQGAIIYLRITSGVNILMDGKGNESAWKVVRHSTLRWFGHRNRTRLQKGIYD